MVQDANGRSHVAKGRPDGGQYECGKGSIHDDTDLTPPTPLPDPIPVESIEDRIRTRLSEDRDLPDHVRDHVIELIHPWLRSADITPGTQPDADNQLIIAVACFDPDGVGGSRADYIEYGLSDALDGCSIRVHDRPALENEVARSIDKRAVNPVREYRRLGLTDRIPPHRKNRVIPSLPEESHPDDGKETSACPICGHDVDRSIMIECSTCGETVCPYCIRENEAGEYECDNCRS